MKSAFTKFSILTSLCLCLNAEVYDLGKVEVTAKKDISQNRTIIFVDEYDISNTQSKNVTEALSYLPGVFVENLGGRNDFGVRIRGFGISRVPIFIDGIPVYVPYDRGTDLNRFTTFDISEISVSKGYTSLMYGANTIGGAVNIITKKPSKSFEGEIGLGAFSGYGQEEYLRLGSKQDKFYAQAILSNYQRKYFNLSDKFEKNGFEDGKKRENSDSKDRKINLKLGYTPNDSDEYAFNYIMQKGLKGQPYDASLDNFPRNWRWPAWDKTSYYFNSKTAFGKHYLKTRLYYDKFYNKLEDFGNLPDSFNASTPKSTSEYDDYTFGGFIQGDFAISDTRLLKISTSYKSDNHKDIDSKNPNLDIKAKSDTISFGGEYSWKINDKLTWIMGLGYDKNNIKKSEYRYGKNPKKPDSIKEYDKYNTDAINAQSALYYQMNDDLMFYANISKKSNMPTLKQRYSSRFNSFVPNPSLKAEKSINYEIGSQYLLNQSHTLDTAVFFTKASDYIDRVKLLQTPPCDSNRCFQSRNVGKEEHYGVEATLNSIWLESLSSSLSYTYIHSKLKNSKDGNKVTGIPQNSIKAQIKYSPIKNLDLISNFKYESKRYESINAEEVNKPFAIMDVKISYLVFKGFEVSGGIKNIFDKNYTYSLGYPQEGRSFFAQVRYSF